LLKWLRLLEKSQKLSKKARRKRKKKPKAFLPFHKKTTQAYCGAGFSCAVLF
jgi:hypothetical protein